MLMILILHALILMYSYDNIVEMLPNPTPVLVNIMFMCKIYKWQRLLQKLDCFIKVHSFVYNNYSISIFSVISHFINT